MLAESQKLEAQIADVQKQLTMLPEGRIFCTRNGNKYKWYHSDGKTQTYIPRKDRQYAEALAVRKYLSSRLEELSQEKKAIDFYLRHHQRSPRQTERMLTEMPEYQELLSPYFKPLSQELQEWVSSPYDHDVGFSENLIFKTSSGNMVRSKSEAMIDMILHINRIPFRYECALKLGTNVIYPDFTIRHPKTGEFFYWEHFGLMDNLDYRQKTGAKLRLYISNGIIPSIQLITTYETADKPLCTEKIENIVREYFL